jgi:acyl-CoA synthetase (AMP-forming)/AMP-acid ligase II
MLGLETLPALLREAAERFGDHPAYVEGSLQLSYADLLTRVETTAAVYAEAGVARGDRVVLWGPNSTDWAVAALAVSYAGGVLVPVNSRYVGPEVADVVARTQAKLVVVHDASEMTRAISLGARNLGINNRDLHTFNVDLGTTERLAPLAPVGAVVIGESGVFGPQEIERLWKAGAQAVLVGEGVIVSPDRTEAVRTLRESVTV